MLQTLPKTQEVTTFIQLLIKCFEFLFTIFTSFLFERRYAFSLILSVYTQLDFNGAVDCYCYWFLGLHFHVEEIKGHFTVICMTKCVPGVISHKRRARRNFHVIIIDFMSWFSCAYFNLLGVHFTSLYSLHSFVCINTFLLHTFLIASPFILKAFLMIFFSQLSSSIKPN